MSHTRQERTPKPQLSNEELMAQADAKLYAYYEANREKWAAERAERNRANAQHSTGPRTEQGKANSSRNSFKHGLYSSQRFMNEEDAQHYQQLIQAYTAEFRPAPGVETTLVTQMAEHTIRLKRMQAMESNIWLDEEDVSISHLNALHRFINSAERGFHKNLKALRDLQRERTKEGCQFAARQTAAKSGAGFVPQNAATRALAPNPLATKTHPEDRRAPQTGFVPSKMNGESPTNPATQPLTDPFEGPEGLKTAA